LFEKKNRKIKNKQKNVVTGLGEIGIPILRLISKKTIAVCYDINQKLMEKKKFGKNVNVKTVLRKKMKYLKKKKL